jgi:hypothetical protein
MDARMTLIIPYDYEFRKRAFYRRWLERGPASRYIKNASDEIKPGDKVVLFCRVSACMQNHNGNLLDSEVHLQERAKQLGANVVGVVRHVGPGWDPSWLATVAKRARQFDAKIFAETTDRLIRNPLYSKERQDLQAREIDLQDLRSWTEGVVLVTDLHPDASPVETRGYQRRRGQSMKNNKGGRPMKRKWKERRLARLKLAQIMRDEGCSYKQIATCLNRHKDGFTQQTTMTVYNWLKRAYKFSDFPQTSKTRFTLENKGFS